MSAERLATIIRNNPGATLYSSRDGDWELIAADQPGIVKPAERLARLNFDGIHVGDMTEALCIIAGINYRR